MPVVDVNVPKATDPKNLTAKPINPEDDTAEFWEKRAKAALARADAKKAEHEAEAAEAGMKAEPPIKMTGEISLGKIDLQGQMAAMASEAAEREKEMNRRLELIGAERDRAKEDNLKLLFTMMQDSTKQQLDQMRALIATVVSGGGANKDIRGQIDDMRTMATALGYVLPSTVPTTSGDLAVQLEIIKLQNAANLENRRWEYQMKQSDREWELKLEELRSGHTVELAKLAQGKERTEMLAKFPEMIGGAVARGLLTQGQEPMEAIGGQPAARRAAPEQQYTLEAYVGEAAVVQCPKCNSEMAFGPSASAAVCANCGLKIPISRVEAPPKAATPPPAPPTEKPPQKKQPSIDD